MNTKRIERKLAEFAAANALTSEQAASLTTLLDVLAEEDDGPLDLTLPGSTEVDTGIAVSAPILTVADIERLEAEHGRIVDADIERKRRIAKAIIAGGATLLAAGLTGGSGVTVAGAALAALKTLSAARAA